MNLECKYCVKICKNVNSLRNHERLCKNNPNKDVIKLSLVRRAASEKITCIYCNELYAKTIMWKHTPVCKSNPEYMSNNMKICPVCDNNFFSKSVTCSNSCANTYFRSNVNHPTWTGENYRAIAKLHHEMICAICGEDKIVSIHHYDENHYNNDPKNLIPLCPTHHAYVHNKKYKCLVIDKIDEYRNSKE